MAVALGPIKTCIACGLKFYVSREHIFSRIWISLFIPGNKFSRTSCTVLESNKTKAIL